MNPLFLLLLLPPLLAPLDTSGMSKPHEDPLSASDVFEMNKDAVVLLQVDGWNLSNKVKGQWSCSGFVYRPSGFIVTNAHCLEGIVSGSVVFSDGFSSPILGVLKMSGPDIIGIDPDFAILKVDVNNVPVVRLGDSDSVKIGDPLWVLGFPQQTLFRAMGEVMPTPSLTGGIATTRKAFNSDWDRFFDLPAIEVIGTDAVINHGNSGGPVIDSLGTVVGIATWGFGGEPDIEVMNFLQPINMLFPSLSADYEEDTSLQGNDQPLPKYWIPMGREITPPYGLDWQMSIGDTDLEMVGKGLLRNFFLDSLDNFGAFLDNLAGGDAAKQTFFNDTQFFGLPASVTLSFSPRLEIVTVFVPLESESLCATILERLSTGLARTYGSPTYKFREGGCVDLRGGWEDLWTPYTLYSHNGDIYSTLRAGYLFEDAHEFTTLHSLSLGVYRSSDGVLTLVAQYRFGNGSTW